MGNGRDVEPRDHGKMLKEILSQGLKPARLGGGGETTTFICGYLACDPQLSKAFLGGLPPLFKVRAVVLMVSAEVALFSVTAVTFEPMPPLMVTVPVLVPVLVMVPLLLRPFVLNVIVLLVPELLTVTFPVPLMPPLKVIAPVVPVLDTVRLLPFSAMAPLKVGAVVVPLLPMITVPAALAARLTGLETVKVFPRRLAEPPAESPKVIGMVEGPAAPLMVPTLLIPATTTPRLIINPPVKVLAPESVSSDVALF